jgi:hypothetical protein
MIDRQTLLADNPVLCPAPFTTLTLKSSGKNIVHSCCCNLNVVSLVKLETIRNNIRAGKPSAPCSMCYKSEELGAQSERKRLVMNMGENDLQQFISNYTVQEKEIFIKFGNLCSLACRSCMPTDSTTYAKVMGVSAGDTVDLSENEESWNYVMELLKETAEAQRPVINLIGGETLIQPGVFKVMRWLIDQDLARRFELRITTSLAVNIDEELKKTFASFNQLSLSLSIDSVGNNYHYVRWPARFEKIQTNLETLLELRNNLNRYIYILQPLFGLNNVMYLSDYTDYFCNWIANRQVWANIAPINLNYPENLSVVSVPEIYKDSIVEEIDRAHNRVNKDQFPGYSDYLMSLARTVSSRASERTFESFLKFTAQFDLRTKTTFQEYNNRLWKLLTPEHQNIYNKHYVQSKI